MAADQVGVTAELGFDRFAVVGHERGARVTHRLALDHAARVERLALLAILPTAYVYRHVDRGSPPPTTTGSSTCSPPDA